MPGSGRSGGLFLFPAPEKQRIVSRCSLHILPPGGNGTAWLLAMSVGSLYPRRFVKKCTGLKKVLFYPIVAYNI